MKKSQVLAAIALAFALGLAPIASTFAVTSIKDQCDEAHQTAQDLILEFGTVDQITALKAHLANLKKAYAPAAADFKAAIVSPAAPGGPLDAVYTVAKAALNNGAKVGNKTLTIDDFAGKNFDQVVALADSATYASYTQNQFDTMVDGAKASLALYITDVRNDLTAIDQVDGLADDATAAQAIAYVEGLPAYAKTIALLDVYSKNACSGDDKAMTKSTDNLNKAIAAYKSTTTNNGNVEDDKKNPGAPNTGAAATAEASATASVSILSGIASVATAAGVVIRKAFRK